MIDKNLLLIIEDNLANMRLAKLMLEKDGFEVLTAISAEKALEVLAVHHPAIILMDLQLPGIDGLQLTSYLKKSPATSDIIIVALTAYASRQDEDRALQAGCDGFIAKPYDILELPEKVRAYLREK